VAHWWTVVLNLGANGQRKQAMAHPHEELIQRGFEAFTKGDRETVKALFADNAI